MQKNQLLLSLLCVRTSTVPPNKTKSLFLLGRSDGKARHTFPTPPRRLVSCSITSMRSFPPNLRHRLDQTGIPGPPRFRAQPLE